MVQLENVSTVSLPAFSQGEVAGALRRAAIKQVPAQLVTLPAFLELTNPDPFAACFVVTGDATTDGIRVVRSILGAVSCLSIVFFRR